VTHLKTNLIYGAVSVACIAGFLFVSLPYVPFFFMAFSLGVLISHEMSHYFSAVVQRGKPNVPLIVFLGITSIGITRVRNLLSLSSRAKHYVIASGPIGGIAAAISLIPYASAFHTSLALTTFLGMLCMEIYNATLGSDGKKRKRERSAHGRLAG